MNVLAISAHPDDETLGCGGTLLKHAAAGDTLHWLIAARAHAPQWSPEVIERKDAEIAAVARAYGMACVFPLGFPAARLDTIPCADLMMRISEVMSEVKPGVVYVVHPGDVHTDHRAVFTATMSVLKPFHMGRLGVRRVLCYETLSSSDAAPPTADRHFSPNVFTDIGAGLDRKIEIMGLYATEAQADPLPRGPSAIRALARYRGAAVGVEYAEAFALMREIL